MRLGDAKVSLRPFSMMMTMPTETSEPVPAVVGIAIRGGILPIFFAPPMIAA